MATFFSAILYYLVLLPISYMPFPVLYAMSDFFFVIIYRLFPYRKKLVMDNIRRSFPEKSEEEVKRITEVFYRHFCDVVFETLKVFTASPAEIMGRMKVKNGEILKEHYRNGKSVIAVTGHYANWEWAAITFSKHSDHKASGIYKQLSNKYFDDKLRSTRARFGTQLMSTREVQDFFTDHANELYTYGFINDQSPSNPAKGHWMKFLNQDTNMLLGAEKYAVKYNFPVVYGKITRLKRGHYQIEYINVSLNPATEPEFAITEKCAIINEELIRSAPEYWLWTHRRWKHKRLAD